MFQISLLATFARNFTYTVIGDMPLLVDLSNFSYGDPKLRTEFQFYLVLLSNFFIQHLGWPLLSPFNDMHPQPFLNSILLFQDP